MCCVSLPLAPEPLHDISAQIPEPRAFHKPGRKIRLTVVDNLKILTFVLCVHTGKGDPILQHALFVFSHPGHPGIHTGTIAFCPDKNFQRQTLIQYSPVIERYSHAPFGDIKGVARKTAIRRLYYDRYIRLKRTFFRLFFRPKMKNTAMIRIKVLRISQYMTTRAATKLAGIQTV